MSNRSLVVAGCVLAFASGSARADGPVLPHLVAELRGLDKITARATTIRAPIGTEVEFGTLRITARACLTTPPTEPPESSAFLEIKVAEPGSESEAKPAFEGWMFASSPSLSALEHPVYDVWVIGCAEPIEPEPEPPPVAPLPVVPGPAPADG